jgi:phage baseplate assembly protein W
MSRLSRAQTLSSGINKEVEVFSDFTTNFLKTPVGDQLARVINDSSIRQSIRNLMLTNTGDRLFQPTIGGNIRELLFENNLQENLITARNYVKTVIERFEPRVQLIDVRMDSPERDPHTVYVTIIYRTLNNSEPQTLTLLFKRVR